MIPKEAFWSIAAVMVLSCAFGYVLRGIVEKGRKNDSEWFYNGSEADHDRWEDDPVPTNTCDTCKYENTKPTEEPCLSCLEDDVDRWEKDE